MNYYRKPKSLRAPVWRLTILACVTCGCMSTANTPQKTEEEPSIVVYFEDDTGRRVEGELANGTPPALREAIGVRLVIDSPVAATFGETARAVVHYSRAIEIRNARLLDADLACVIDQLKQPTELKIVGSILGPKSLASIAQHESLTNLAINRCVLDAECDLSRLASLQRLEALSLVGLRLEGNNGGVRLPYLRYLSELRLERCSGLTGESVVGIVEGAPLKLVTVSSQLYDVVTFLQRAQRSRPGMKLFIVRP